MSNEIGDTGPVTSNSVSISDAATNAPSGGSGIASGMKRLSPGCNTGAAITEQRGPARRGWSTSRSATMSAANPRKWSGC